MTSLSFFTSWTKGRNLQKKNSKWKEHRVHKVGYQLYAPPRMLQTGQSKQSKMTHHSRETQEEVEEFEHEVVENRRRREA